MKRNKYGVAPRDRRTFNGTTYASRAEARRAMELDVLLRAGVISGVEEQVRFPLGPDIVYVADFVITEQSERWAEEIKGYETPGWRLRKRLWKKYGTLPLLVYHAVGRGWRIEQIVPQVH